VSRTKRGRRAADGKGDVRERAGCDHRSSSGTGHAGGVVRPQALDLSDRLVRTRDVEEQTRLEEELAVMTFGE
jgi:hypothetical protein